MRRWGWMLLAGVAALAGCKQDSASLAFPGPDHALTLVARQPWPWSKTYNLEVVMARLPDCHRRSRLDPVRAGELRLEVLRPAEGVFTEPILVLRQGAGYFALGTRNCELQRFPAAPKEPGLPLGAFEMSGGKLKFLAAPQPAAPQAAFSPPPAAPSPPAPPQQ